jgi:hypothetical protein
MLSKLFAGILLFVLTSSCSIPEFNSDYAIEAVKLSDGQTIYFKREVRGITGNYDVIAVSTNSDPCASCNPKTDYCLDSYPEAVYYKVAGDTLHIYGYGGIKAPEKFPGSSKIEAHAFDNFSEWESSYGKKGIIRMELKATKECK